MAEDLVTLATFPTPVEAGFVRNLLEAEGVRAYLADEMTAGMFWQLGNTIGWVKLQVSAADLLRANEILEERQHTLADVGQEAFAAEATSSPSEETSVTTKSGIVICPGCGKKSDASAGGCWFCGADLEDVPASASEPDASPVADPLSSAVAEPDDDVEDPLEILASRAFRAAGIGLIFFPLLFYAAWLIFRLVLSKAELSDRASRHMWLAFIIAAAGFAGYWMLWIYPIYSRRPI